MSGNIALALDCSKYAPGDTDWNISMITASVRKAIESGCDIICFPEACITGYSTENISTINEGSDSIIALSELSKDITIVAGGFERADKDFITQYVFNDGRITVHKLDENVRIQKILLILHRNAFLCYGRRNDGFRVASVSFHRH